jgi:hypothetical protein
MTQQKCACGHIARQHHRAKRRKRMITACKRCLCHGWRPVTTEAKQRAKEKRSQTHTK